MTTSKNILILGGGLQGSVVAKDLLKAGFNVTVADVSSSCLALQPDENGNIPKYMYLDVKDLNGSYREFFINWFKNFDIIVGCLPARFGLDCMKAVIAAEKNYIDLSFMAEDSVVACHEAAQQAGCIVVPDCGVTPGLSNLLVGHICNRNTTNNVENDAIRIYVGGVADDKNEPYGYTPTWALTDLYEEYVRPARYLDECKIYQRDPLNLNELEYVNVPGPYGGVMEAFTSDGLRTLLFPRSNQTYLARNMIEKTLRWPGHTAQMRKLVIECKGDPSMFVARLNKELNQGKPDVFHLIVCVNDEKFILTATEKHGVSAMARVTGHTCSTFVRLLNRLMANKDFDMPTGVVPPELLVQLDKSIYSFAKQALQEHGLVFKRCEADIFLDK